jgi:hypothetical protein
VRFTILKRNQPMQTSILSEIKNFIVIICCASSALSVQAQTFTILPSNTQTVTFSCDSSMQGNIIHISNPNPNALDLSYTVILNTLPQEGCWYYQFCDWEKCAVHIPTTTKHPDVAVPANSSGSTMTLDVITLSAKGAGDLSVKLFETNNPTNFQIITWNVTGCATGNECGAGIVESSFENSIAVYPNPAMNTITVEARNLENSHALDVFNLIGKNVIHQDVSKQGKCTLNISKLEKGIYLIEIHAANNVVVTKKFIKN